MNLSSMNPSPIFSLAKAEASRAPRKTGAWEKGKHQRCFLAFQYQGKPLSLKGLTNSLDFYMLEGTSVSLWIRKQRGEK